MDASREASHDALRAEGAAVAFGLMGMAEAIRVRQARENFRVALEAFAAHHEDLLVRLGD